MCTTEVSQELFVEFFRPSIRVLLNWKRLLAESWPIDMSILDAPEAAKQFYLPWYLSGPGSEVEYGHANARPARAFQISHFFNQLSEDKKITIQGFVQQFKKMRTPIQLVIPAYGLTDANRLVLDGNHRVAALALANVPFKVMLFTVVGPLEGDALPDLIHWQRT